MAAIDAATRLFALLGDPVSHSLSPRMQTAAFRAAGLNGIYVALRCSADDLPGLLRGMARANGGGNVTVPHKGAAASIVEEPSEALRRTGACNTFWLEEGRIQGDNTDVAGLLAAVARLIADPAGARVLLLGAGGAAQAAVAALLDAAVDRIQVRNRTRARAEALLAAFPDAADRLDLLDPARSLRHERFDLVINATSLGLHPGEPLPLELAAVGHVGAALDLAYAPGETAWIRAAHGLDIPATDGIEMLIGQGMAAFERWWRQPAPEAAMRQAVQPG